ncbi:hypothetical protein [Neorhizobium sp. NCHU2750]|uniref:hypothetical protein n=1 Tax=Neorhizobium sp. NCHU2750 TaxID=1825976 RepID=UPI000E71EB5F|nr:hypothetical protein NCHU2750_06360 [Neorhizobium sp. NCHU2750]
MGLEWIALAVSSIATTQLAATALYLGTYALAYTGLAYGSMLLNGLVNKTEVPKPDDGSYNLKQNVPSLAYVLGKTKKGGDYVFLEEKDGWAYHIIVWAGHRINGFTQHYLHDEPVTLGLDGWIASPDHFEDQVQIQTRLGTNVGVPYSDIVTKFPDLWTNNHRGDGLASIMMVVTGVPAEDYSDVFPNGMPEHSAVGEGRALYDPRKDSTQGGSGSHRYDNEATWQYSSNLALMRLWHLCNPVGGKLSFEDMYMPEWINAANVCDQQVTNRSGGSENRYHGGFWFRAENSPTDVGAIMDDAGEMVVYERADGLVGVHAGEFFEPDIRLVKSDIISININKNKADANTVLAVRGQYVNPDNAYNTEDAAIYGDPYAEADDLTERTKTYQSECVQSHNHCQRKQKLTFIRTNARKISLVATYEAAKNAPYRRFIKVHYPPKAIEATIEIIETPQIDLQAMTISLSGIIVDASLYDFDAATEEGTPGNIVEINDSSGVPEPVGVSISVINEVVSGGSTAARIKATWTHYSDALTYQLQWVRTDGSSAAESVYSTAGDDEVSSGYLVDGAEYKARLRAWGSTTSSDWTDYVPLTATADPVPPDSVTNASVSVDDDDATFIWTAPNSSNYYACRIYIGLSDTFANATLMATEYGGPGLADQRTILNIEDGHDYYGWLVAINASGVAAPAVSVGMFTIAA